MPSSNNSGNLILLFHGGDNFNIGDDAQMYSAYQRIQQAGYQILLGENREGDFFSESLGPTCSTPRIYICRPLPWWVQSVVRLLTKYRIRKIPGLIQLLIFLFRAWKILLATRCEKWFGFVPLLNKAGRQAVGRLSHCQLLWFTGGGWHNDLWRVIEVLPRCTTARMAGIWRIPVVLSGQQVGPVKSRLTRFLTRWGKEFLWRQLSGGI